MEPAHSVDMDCLQNLYFALPSRDLAALLALLEETTLFNALQEKAASLLHQNGHTLGDRLAKRTRELAQKPLPELQLTLLNTFSRELRVPPQRYIAPQDIHNHWSDITQACLKLLQQQDKTFRGSTLKGLSQHYLQKAIVLFEQHFQELSPEEQERLEEQFWDALPEERRQKLLKKLPKEELAREYVRTAGKTSLTGVGFSSLIAAGGFASYSTAVSLLAGSAKLVGLTLPFAAYTTLTSTIAVLANPLFLALLFGGGGKWFYDKQNTSLRQQLIPLTLAQLYSSEEEETNYENSPAAQQQFLTFCSQLYQEHQHCRQRFLQAQEEESCARSQRLQKKEQLQRQQEALTRLQQQQQELRTQLANLIAQKAYVLSSEPGWASLGQRLLQLQRQQNDLSAQQRPSGLFKRLCQTVSRKTEEFSLQKQLRQASQEGAAQLLQAFCQQQPVPAWTRPLLDQLNHCRQQIQQGEDEERQSTIALKTAKEYQRTREQQREEIHRQLQCIEKRWWGLEQLP